MRKTATKTRPVRTAAHNAAIGRGIRLAFLRKQRAAAAAAKIMHVKKVRIDVVRSKKV